VDLAPEKRRIARVLEIACAGKIVVALRLFSVNPLTMRGELPLFDPPLEIRTFPRVIKWLVTNVDEIRSITLRVCNFAGEERTCCGAWG
jgi:hypothetical protein